MCSTTGKVFASVLVKVFRHWSMTILWIDLFGSLQKYARNNMSHVCMIVLPMADGPSNHYIVPAVTGIPRCVLFYHLP